MSAALIPWVTLRPADNQDDWRWWDCECSAYNGAPTLDEAVADANEHARDCRKGERRWQAMPTCSECGDQPDGPGFCRKCGRGNS